MTVPKPTSKVIVIDTGSYSGNFEYELFAHITGQFGLFSRAREVAERARPSIVGVSWWQQHVVTELDDDDNRVPAAIWPTPGFINNGMGQHYRDDPENRVQARQDAKAALEKYHAPRLEMLRRRIEQSDYEPASNGWSKEGCEREIATIERNISTAGGQDGCYPAYQSVAIFVDDFPPQAIVDEMMDRALDFGRNYTAILARKYATAVEEVDILGFRRLDPNAGIDEALVRSATPSPSI